MLRFVPIDYHKKTIIGFAYSFARKKWTRWRDGWMPPFKGGADGGFPKQGAKQTNKKYTKSTGTTAECRGRCGRCLNTLFLRTVKLARPGWVFDFPK